MFDLATHLADLDPLLARFRSAPVRNQIGGEAMTARAGAVFQVRSPWDDSLIAEVARSDADDVDAAAQAAKTAFAEWRETPMTERRRILHAIADSIDAHAYEIALVESWDTGQPIRFMANAAARGSANFRFFADKSPSAEDGLMLPSPNLMNVTTRVPIGPIGVITPWNTPFMLATWKIAPALAAGCTVVHKPAELAPLTARLLVEIAEDAGLPKGVWNVVNGLGEEAGRALTQHRDIKAISFVGESATGAEVMGQGAPTLKRVQFELGGKNPILVFDDADQERALDAALLSIYALNGQRCTSSSRLLVHDTIADAFEAALTARAKRIRVGHPLDPATEVGPLISDGHFAKVMSYITRGQTEGAKLVAGGNSPLPRCVAPTVFSQAQNDMSIARDEIFGPVLTVIRFSDEADAIQVANDTDYGLTGYVWTNDLTRAMRVTRALEAGMIWVNSENVRHLPAPFGGMKMSGIGREGGDWSFDFYTEQKMIGFATGQHDIARLGVS